MHCCCRDAKGQKREEDRNMTRLLYTKDEVFVVENACSQLSLAL